MIMTNSPAGYGSWARLYRLRRVCGHCTYHDLRMYPNLTHFIFVVVQYGIAAGEGAGMSDRITHIGVLITCS